MICILTASLAVVAYEVSLKGTVPKWSHNLRIILFPYTKYPSGFTVMLIEYI